MTDIRYGRKKNGIIRDIKDKLNDWFNSIQDEEVRCAVRKNTIVTGGSIASMLLGETVNDYDLYFRDKKTTIMVANYYVNKFNETFVKKQDSFAVGYVPQVQEQTITNCKGIQEDRIIIYMKSAGVAAEDQDTYDYFEQLPSNDQQAKFAEQLIADKMDAGPKYRPIFLSRNAITLSNKVQLVIRFFGEPDKIHDNYDFAHAMCYYDSGSDKLVLPAEALECLLSRTLIYRGSLYPIASIFRMKKFLERGWRISAGQQLKIMWQISELDLHNHAVIEEQLTGVDQAYLWQLSEAIKSVDDASKVDSTYVAAIIDRIFD